MKRPPLAASSNLALRLSRARARSLLEDREVRMQRRIEATNAVENGVRRFDWETVPSARRADRSVVRTRGAWVHGGGR
jgi:hypothetical protein